MIPLLLAGAGGLLSACVAAPKWRAQKTVTTELVAQTLDEPGAINADLRPEDIPQLPVRVHLRPCCAFGTQLQASLGPVPIPFFSIGNITSVDELGPHKYDSGAFSVKGSSPKNAFERPLILRRRTAAHGVQFADLRTLEVEVDVPDPFPFPRPGSTRITQADFPAIIEAVREKVVKFLGPGSDRPERDAR